MEKSVIIFGIKDYAELAHYYLENDSPYKVSGFSVDSAYMPDNPDFKGLPVIPFEQVEETFPPDSFCFFSPMAPNNMNQLRGKKYREIKEKGYEMISYVSSKATVFNNKIGENCFILEDNTLQPFTDIGNNVVLWSGNHIGHHGKIEDHVTITSHVVISGHCEIREHAFLGVNATIRDGVTIEKGSLIGMAASIVKNTEEWGIYIGNPAKKVPNKKSYDAL